MNKYYKRGILFPAALILIGHLLFVVIYEIIGVGKSYKSEWLGSDSGLFFAIAAVIINIIVIMALSRTMYLNSFEKIRNNMLLNFLSWFLLPCSWMGHLLLKHIRYLEIAREGLDFETLFVLTNTIPFLIGLILTYWEFRRNINKTAEAN